MDELLAAEAFQRDQLAGLHSHEAMILNYNPTQAVLPAWPKFDIIEARWHPIFKKCRWYDLRRPVADGFPSNGTLDPRLPPGAIWTVDEPVIWEALRPCLEMASRIFAASLNLPFWDALLNVQPMRDIWSDKDGLAHDIMERPYLAIDPDGTDQYPRRDWDQLIDIFADYAKDMTFSFFPVPDDPSYETEGTQYY